MFCFWWTKSYFLLNFSTGIKHVPQFIYFIWCDITGLLETDTNNHVKDTNGKPKDKANGKLLKKKHRNRANEDPDTIRLEPSKRRTRGKKTVLQAAKCVIL